MIGIWGIGGGGKTTLATAFFNKISFQFDGKSFIENVREVSKASSSGLMSLQSKILSNVLGNRDIKVGSVLEGKNMMSWMMRGRKVLLVLDDVDGMDQLEALAGDRSWFKPGSIIIITTREQQHLVRHGVMIHKVNLLTKVESTCLFSRHAFGKDDPIQGYKELSRKVVCYSDGLPLTIKVLGSFLCSKSKTEWEEALARLETIPLKETQKVLEISYTGLDKDYKEIFLDVAILLKGWPKDFAIKSLESRGFHARIGLRVLEQKSLITIADDECVDMHDHLEELGRNIVRCSQPPTKDSRLWNREEIEDALVNDLGTEATRCIQFYYGRLSPGVLMNGLRKMKELWFLDVQYLTLKQGINKLTPNFLDALVVLCFNLKFCKVSPHFPDALRYLRWDMYPFRSLPKTFQANNLVTLQMADSNIVQLWKGGERKVLNKLRFLELSGRKLRTFDLGQTPNLETLTLARYGHEPDDLVKLYMPGKSLKLRSCVLDGVKLRGFDLGLTPNLKELSLGGGDLVELHVPNTCLNLKYLHLTCLKLRTLDIGLTPNLEDFYVKYCDDLEELHIAEECVKLRSIHLAGLKLRTLNLVLSPDLERLDLKHCDDLEEFHIAECQKLTDIRIRLSRLRTLDLRVTPNLKKLDLKACDNLVELHAPITCLKNLVDLDLSCCLAFRSFSFKINDNTCGIANESLEVRPLAELYFTLKNCLFHPDNCLLKFESRCFHKEDLHSLTRSIEKLISVRPCACTKLERFSRSICRLQD